MFPGLLISQQNELFRLIEGAGFDPADFEWKDLGLAGAELCYRNFTFRVYQRRGHRDVTYTPGDESRSETHEADAWGDFSGCFAAWLTNVKRETAEPDLWEQLYQQAELIRTELLPPESGKQDERFTQSEIEEITSGLNRVRVYLLENAVRSATDSKLVESRLDYIIQALPSHRRFDWANLAMGALLSLLAGLATNGDIARGAWHLFQGVLNNFPKVLH
jgi:hypothetical protein